MLDATQNKHYYSRIVNAVFQLAIGTTAVVHNSDKSTRLNKYNSLTLWHKISNFSLGNPSAIYSKLLNEIWYFSINTRIKHNKAGCIILN